MMRHVRYMRTFRGPVLLWVFLMAMSGGFIPSAALALPGNPDPPGGDDSGDPGGGCAPQVVSPDQAVLNGFVYVVDPPMVGHTTRIRISNPTIQLPDPRCDDGRVL